MHDYYPEIVYQMFMFLSSLSHQSFMTKFVF